jgi:hypothetical protein
LALDQVRRLNNHPHVIRSIASSLRCALVAMLAIAIVVARPAMMASHATLGMGHGCGMAMTMPQSSHPDHDCSGNAKDACCDDCMCACAIGSDVREPAIALVATYTRVVTVIARPNEVVRVRRQPALRLPPPLGPPLITRS